MTSEPRLIKICLVNKGADSETPWAEDLGPATKAPLGSRNVRLFNVPFLHAKPTWGDVIVVSPDHDGLLTWDRDGVAYDAIAPHILDDSGRWTMIVDYSPHAGVFGESAFVALARACAEHDVVCEGAWTPQGNDQPGRAYLAVPDPIDDVVLMAHFEAARLPCDLLQIHPARPHAAAKPAKPAKRRATTKRAKRPAAKVRAKPPAKPRPKQPAKRSSTARRTTGKRR